jgi:hypothetical protein
MLAGPNRPALVTAASGNLVPAAHGERLPRGPGARVASLFPPARVSECASWWPVPWMPSHPNQWPYGLPGGTSRQLPVRGLS